MNKIKTVAFVVIILGVVPLIAQAQQGFGLNLDDVTFDKIPRMPEQTSGTKSLDNIPLRKDLSQYSPEKMPQGKPLSCVAWATAYYAYGIQYAIQHQLTDHDEINRIALSAMYPYKKLRPGCEQGLDLDEVARFIKQNGNITFTDLSDAKCEVKIPAGARPVYPIKDYQAVFNAKTDKPNQCVQSVIQAIAYNDLPVIVGMEVWDWFLDFKADDLYYDPARKGKVAYGHAMTIVGYDLRKKAFKILNSWGRNWGEEGCFWIKFDDFSKVAKKAIVLILPDEPLLSTEITRQAKVGGLFQFRYLDDKQSDFVTTSPRHKGGGVYALDKKNWTVGQAFQLVTNNSRNGQSMCVFSINDKGRVKLHWPKDLNADGQLKNEYGMRTGDRLPVKNFDIVIPGPESALIIDEAGTDYLCVFYSEKPLIDELPAVLDRIRKSKGSIAARLSAGLGVRLINPGQISYEPDEMRFSANSDTGDTVPLVLTIESVKE